MKTPITSGVGNGIIIEHMWIYIVLYIQFICGVIYCEANLLNSSVLDEEYPTGSDDGNEKRTLTSGRRIKHLNKKRLHIEMDSIPNESAINEQLPLMTNETELIATLPLKMQTQNTDNPSYLITTNNTSKSNQALRNHSSKNSTVTTTPQLMPKDDPGFYDDNAIISFPSQDQQQQAVESKNLSIIGYSSELWMSNFTTNNNNNTSSKSQITVISLNAAGINSSSSILNTSSSDNSNSTYTSKNNQQNESTIIQRKLGNLELGSHVFVIIILSTMVIVALVFTIFGLIMKAEAHSKSDITSALLFDDKHLLSANSLNFNSFASCEDTGV